MYSTVPAPAPAPAPGPKQIDELEMTREPAARLMCYA